MLFLLFNCLLLFNIVNSQANGTHRAWSGANSFFAWALPQDNQLTLNNTLRAKNVRVIRILLATIDGGQGGSRALPANDIERYRVGSPYTDSDMIVRVDQFIKNVAIHGGPLRVQWK